MQAKDLRRASAFISALGLVLLYALRGGAYDLVVREEMAVGILWLIGLGLGLGLLPVRRPAWPPLLALAGLSLLALLTAIALGHTGSQEKTGIELARVLHHGAVFVLPLLVLSRRTWTAAAAGVVAGVLLVSVIALASRLFPAIATDVVARAFASERLSYPLNYWNALGAWSATGIAGGLAWSAHARSRAARALALAAVPCAIACAYLTYSRGSIISAGLGVIVVLALARHRVVSLLHALLAGAAGAVAILAIRAEPAIARGTGTGGRGLVLLVLVGGGALAGVLAATTRRRGRSLRVPRPIARSVSAAVVLAVIVAGIALGPHAVSAAYRSYEKTDTPASTPTGADPAQRLTNLSGTRRHLWRAALDAYQSDPARGIGPGTFSFYWNQHGSDGEFVRDAHSLYLENLAELGWPGLVAVLLTLGGLGLTVLRVRSRTTSGREAGALAAVAATLVIFAFSAGVDWMWESTANASVALGSVGIAAAALGGGRRPGRRAVRIGLRAGLALLAFIALLVQLPSLVSTSAVRRSQADVRSADLIGAFDAAQDAVSSEPWAASAYVQRALVLEREGRLGAAHVDLLRAIRREPQEWSDRLVLARIDAERGDARAALAAFAAARRLRPLSPVFSGIARSGSP